VRNILLKAALVAVGSIVASTLIVVTVVPALGAAIDGTTLLMAVICPLAISFPASAHTFWQADRLRRAHSALARAHAELAAAHRRLSEKASRDSMTGLLNRESFMTLLEGSRRKNDRGALLIIDADHFKKINDNFGHLVGDEALRAITGAIRRGVRAGDTVARIGGEEFAALLSSASLAEAMDVAERIRREVEAVRFQAADGRLVPLTVSIGGVICPAEAAVSELLRGADRRLYAAKHSGRNRVIFEQELPVAA
jgi:diguanylate cyclase (GGDEF)-like protein